MLRPCPQHLGRSIREYRFRVGVINLDTNASPLQHYSLILDVSINSASPLIKEVPHAAIAALQGASPKSAYTELGAN